MPIVPGVTLTADAKSILGNAALQGFLRITLCGYGPALPAVPGVTMLADAGIPRLVGPASSFSQALWGNDVITPAKTFYEVAILDKDGNVIQAGLYQFFQDIGLPATITMIEVVTFLPRTPDAITYLIVTFTTAPTPQPGMTITFAGLTSYVALNGQTLTWEPNPVQGLNQLAFLFSGANYGPLGDTGTITAGPMDLSLARQIVGPYGFNSGDLQYLPCFGAVPGSTYMAPARVLAVAYNGVLMPEGALFPILSYTVAVDQVTITLNFATVAEDRIDAFCVL